MIARSMDCKVTVRLICSICRNFLKKIVKYVQRLGSKGDTAIFERILGKFCLLLFWRKWATITQDVVSERKFRHCIYVMENQRVRAEEEDENH